MRNYFLAATILLFFFFGSSEFAEDTPQEPKQMQLFF